MHQINNDGMTQYSVHRSSTVILQYVKPGKGDTTIRKNSTDFSQHIQDE